MKRRYLSLLASAGLALFYTASTANAQPSLGSAQSFGVLGASTVTNTGATIISGDLGVWPGTSITGFYPPGILSGTIHAGDAVAKQAQADALSAYTALAGLPVTPVTGNLTGRVLGNLGGSGSVATLTPGVYHFDSSAQLTGTLVLDAQNNPNAFFVFQIGTTITTASDASVVVINNSSKPCAGSIVFWQVGTSATLGTGTHFVGNILADASITLTTGVAIDGRAIAIVGAVTMDTNSIAVCNGGNDKGPPPPPPKVTCGGEISVPRPDSDDPSATGKGRATFSCHAHSDKSGGEKGECEYFNHVTGLHVHCTVNEIEVIATDSDGEPKTLRLSGTCSSGGTFSVTVEDHGESGRDDDGRGDEFGITVVTAAGLVECRTQRVITEGHVKFHEER